METNDPLLSFNKLIEDFKTIPLNTSRLPTFLEIAGKAKKEDVISNILAFFFDSKQPHKLGSLFYNTFLQCMGVEESIPEIITVRREVTTSKGKRIDLLIDADNCLLVIENKLYHYLNNDLNEYAAHARRLDKTKKCYLGVLSLFPNNSIRAGFTNVTYDKFIGALKGNIEKFGLIIDPNYEPFLKDFFVTLMSLKSQKMLDEQIRNFFVANQKEIGRFMKEKERFDDEINIRSQKLMSLFDNHSNVVKSIWRKHVIVNQRIFPNNLTLKVDCAVGYNGFWIHVWVSKPGTDTTTSNLLESIPYFKDVSNWNVWLKEELSYDMPLEQVAGKVNEVLRLVFLNQANVI